MKVEALCLSLLFLSGCMSFNANRIAVREIHPSPPGSTSTVSCAAHAFGRTFNREKPPIGAIMDDQSGASLQANQICRLWKQDGLISNWDEPGNIASPDYELMVDGDFNESGSMFASFLTGLTLFLIPSSSSMELDIRGTLTRRSTGQKFNAHSVNSWSTWTHLIFLPAFPFLGVGTMHCQRDIARDLFSQFDAAGAFAPAAVGGAPEVDQRTIDQGQSVLQAARPTF